MLDYVRIILYSGISVKTFLRQEGRGIFPE